MAELSFPAALAFHVERDPHHVAIVHEDRSVTRRQLHDRATERARRMLGDGVGVGDLVVIRLPNGIEFFEAVVAAWMIGAVPLPLSARLTAAEFDAVLAVVDPATTIDGARPPSADPPPEGIGVDLADVVSPHWKAIATGGSTGTPKVVVDQRPALADPLQPVTFMRVDGVQLVAGPLYHSGPFINAVNGLLSGATLVVMGRFDASLALELIERHRVDWALLVPTMQLRIWRLGAERRRRADMSSLRVVMSSGGAYPAWLKAEMIAWLGADRIYEAYGGTELLGGTFITGAEALEHPGSVGRCRPDCLMRILDDDGTEVAPGEVGQVWFARRDGRPTYAYLGTEDRREGSWGSFGDLGHVDADGYLYLADRRTDMIVTGAVNVSPAEVEAAVESHPSVRSCVVIGLADDELGQRVHAIVDVGASSDALGESHSELIEALAAHVGGLLSSAKRPRTWELVAEPLRDDAGKVRRAALRAERERERGAGTAQS